MLIWSCLFRFHIITPFSCHSCLYIFIYNSNHYIAYVFETKKCCVVLQNIKLIAVSNTIMRCTDIVKLAREGLLPKPHRELIALHLLFTSSSCRPSFRAPIRELILKFRPAVLSVPNVKQLLFPKLGWPPRREEGETKGVILPRDQTIVLQPASCRWKQIRKMDSREKAWSIKVYTFRYALKVWNETRRKLSNYALISLRHPSLGDIQKQ